MNKVYVVMRTEVMYPDDPYERNECNSIECVFDSFQAAYDFIIHQDPEENAVLGLYYIQKDCYEEIYYTIEEWKVNRSDDMRDKFCEES